MKYLLLGGSFIFSFYKFPSFHDFIIFSGLVLLCVLVMNDVGNLVEKRNKKEEDERLRKMIYKAFPSPEFSPHGKKVIIERVKEDEYQVYTKKGAYSFIAERGPFDLIFGIKKEKLSDVDFSNIIA
ncbi:MULTISPECIES: hypothetical protein [Bacillus cereus group]|uniref:Uncharacterized protein n=1 Tax=Bacillus thuringiensis TaxID=1428 RepID=A0A9X6VD23_BACTU|nr:MULTISPECIES: hypothetical protein [Bacillus cereus group]MEC3269847.1 hypothetical protein [Bacillus thuringiensis]PFB08222.1 hypothetical protein CN398_09270 [Bacillus thuringiensis]